MNLSKIGRTTLGGLLIVAGLVLSLPGVIGPGLLIILLGLLLLARDHERAERWVERAKDKLTRRSNQP